MRKHSLVNSSVPKYVQLAGHIRSQIGAGLLKPGDRLPSLTELKATYGISQATMERLHADLEQDGLIIRRQGSGTFVTERGLRKRTGIVGVTGLGLLKERSSIFWSKILDGMQSVAVGNEIQMLLVEKSPLDPGWSKVDGVITDYPLEVVHCEFKPQIPVVQLLSDYGIGDFVGADDYEAGRASVNYLLSLGHRRIAALLNFDYQPAHERINGYRAALHEAGITPPPDWTRMIADLWPNFFETGREQMLRWMRENWNELGCTAIIANNDPVALGIIDALRAADLSVPDDVSVVGYDATGLFDFASPKLTSMAMPLEAIGRQAMLNMMDRLEGVASEPRYKRLHVPLRVGDSTKAVICNDERG